MLNLQNKDLLLFSLQDKAQMYSLLSTTADKLKKKNELWTCHALELKCDSLWALCHSWVPATTTPWRWPDCSASANELESKFQVTMWHFTSFTLSFTPRVGWTWKWHNQRTWLPSCNNLSGGYSLGVNKPWGFSRRQNNRQPLWNTNWRERTFYSNNVFAGSFFMLVCSVLIIIFPFSPVS